MQLIIFLIILGLLFFISQSVFDLACKKLRPFYEIHYDYHIRHRLDRYDLIDTKYSFLENEILIFIAIAFIITIVNIQSWSITLIIFRIILVTLTMYYMYNKYFRRLREYNMEKNYHFVRHDLLEGIRYLEQPTYLIHETKSAAFLTYTQAKAYGRIWYSYAQPRSLYGLPPVLYNGKNPSNPSEREFESKTHGEFINRMDHTAEYMTVVNEASKGIPEQVLKSFQNELKLININ